MNPRAALLLDRWGYLILAALVIGEQVGIPLPAVPALLGVGSLAANGRISLPLVLGTVAAAGLTADLVWFELGRRRGRRVLDALRRVSRAPDARLRRAENLIRRYAVPAVLIAKFIPGLTSVTPPLAGIFGIARARFLLYDLAGILLWQGPGPGSAMSSVTPSGRRPPWPPGSEQPWASSSSPSPSCTSCSSAFLGAGASPGSGWRASLLSTDKAVEILPRVRAEHPRAGVLCDRHGPPRLRRPGRLSAKPRVLFRNAPVRRAFTTARKHKPRWWHGS